MGYSTGDIIVNILMRKCPICKEKEIYYTTKREFEIACKNNSYCKKCSPLKRGTREKKYSRKCPNCGKNLFYTNIKYEKYEKKEKMVL
jgi:ssDNA-binding Zn-finger/Zn-ribbon topoisomerase 1